MLSPLKSALHGRRNRSIVSFGTNKDSVLNIKEGELAVLTYTSAADKMKAFSSFIREGLANGDKVCYIYPDEESPEVRKRLVQHGINPDKADRSEKSGNLMLKSASEFYLTKGKFDVMAIIKKELELRSQAKRAGYKHFRYLDDLGNLSFLEGDWEAFMEYWDDPSWEVLSGPGQGLLSGPFIMELTAINVDGRSDQSTRRILNALKGERQSQIRLFDFLEYTDAFSKLVRVSHEDLQGRRILLEFDPTSDYEQIVENIAKEALAHLEPVFVFTRHASGVYEPLARQRSVKILLMSASASTSKPISDNQIILPADNTPLVLDSLRELTSRTENENLLLIFDNISELIMCVGFDKAYKFLLCAMEMLSSKPAIALFLINKSAHGPQETSRVRGLFQNILLYEGDVLHVIKKTPSS